MIGGIGLMNWLRAWQVSRIVASTSSTCGSSTPARIVACDCLRNPPCEWRRVTRYSLSVSASTSAPASSGCTIAMTSFIGRRLYPAPLETLRHGQASLVNSGDVAGADSPHDRAHPSPRGIRRHARAPGGGCPRKQPPGGRGGVAYPACLTDGQG